MPYPVNALLGLPPAGPTKESVNNTLQQLGQWGLRYGQLGPYDKPMKGDGWLGTLLRKDGGVSSELSVGVNIDGRETEIPLMVPTLSVPEINYLLSMPDNAQIPQSILQKAQQHALQRLRQQKSPFKD